MSISSNSTVPELLLEVNAIKKTVRYRSVTKTIPDTHWDDVIVPFLYPTWDSDRDKLVMFGWYSNSTFIAQRRKYTKNFKTGEFYWKDYEMEQLDESASTVFEKFKETFFLVDSLETEEYQAVFAKMHAASSQVSWLTVRLARNFLLDETDHVFVSDSPYSDEDKEMYRLYRQKLRDLPAAVASSDAIDVKFPISPRYFKSIWLDKNPDATYLTSDDQFVELTSHYLTTFREKIASYLISRSITEGVMFNSFYDALRKAGVVYDNPTVLAKTDVTMTADERAKVTEVLEDLLRKVEEEGNA